MVAQSAYSSTTFLLPDLEADLSVFPDNGLNDGPKMRAFMDNFELINSYCYPYAEKDGLRATMDLTNMLWLYDEFTDTESGQDARKSASVVEQALRDPDFDDGSWLCLIIKDFKQLHLARAGPDTARRFLEHLCSYARTVGKEAELRERDEILDIRGYIALRREIGGVKSCFDLVEYCLDINLPQEIYEDPVFVSGYNAAMDQITWSNYLNSYNLEQAKGRDGVNIIKVIMKTKALGLQAAVDFLGGYCEALIGEWQTARDTLSGRPGKKYSDAVRVLDAFGDWIRGNVVWNFVTERYFGARNTDIRNTHRVALKVPFTANVYLKE
ncbi:isoprenoid synthase domain-containing protein [Mucidula mucida]|nr:isoprenoid synthase domain-containing protein [Mucidula mucida]